MSKQDIKKFNGLKKNRYFHGQLLRDRDFREEQVYRDTKRKMHNRLLHGYGVVNGLEMNRVGTTNDITIAKGFALDHAGNEIYVDEVITIDDIVQRCKDIDTQNAPCIEPDGTKTKVYVVLSYYEDKSDFEAVLAPGSGCEPNVCEYSRVSEGYAVELKTDIQLSSYEGASNICDMIDKDKIKELLYKDAIYPYPSDCSTGQEVILGSVTLENGKIIEDGVNNWDGRKYIMTFGLLAHWMDVLGADKLPFEAIVRYCVLGDSSITLEEIKKYLCKESDKS